ncbi:MerR family transcriptional regulator [Microbacterium sp. YY-01]|uniref:transcriptional regulator FtsR n=1 Tax=Microbacterium sp. YY-01 TaxID=3421634 RepID=UPI003D17EDB9
MAAAKARERTASSGLLSIGQVLARLTPDFPQLTSSKLRFLEVQGIVSPSRTESGYRKFSTPDVDRLRLALTLQRDHYLPLSVIREHLDDIDAGRSPDAPTLPVSITPQARHYRRDDVLRESGAHAQLLNDAISTGLIAAVETYSERTVALLRSLVALDRHGIEPRHLRVLSQSVQREITLVESALAPLLRRTDSVSRERAAETAPELAAKMGEVRQALVKEALDRLLS